MKVAAIVQARMTSSRLPGKSLAVLGDATILEWVLRRVDAASSVDETICATSVHSSDDAIESEAVRLGVRVVRGSLDDVLDRYRQAADVAAPTTIVRVTADCPFVDPGIIDLAIGALDEASADYASTSQDGRYPRGLDVEAISTSVLREAAAEATDPLEREHVTLFVYRRPDRFTCVPVVAPDWARRPDLRVTVDEPADLDLARVVVARLGDSPLKVATRSIVELLTAEPALSEINGSVEHRNVR